MSTPAATPAANGELPARPRAAFEPSHRSNVPRLSLEIGEACEALGVGPDFWREHIAAEVRVVRRGRKKLVPVAELERWLRDNAELVLEEGR